MEIHERIQKLRKTLGLSRRAFGEKIGVTESVIVNIEFNRLKKPDQKEPVYKLICREFGVNEVWLRTGEGGDEDMFTKVSKNDRFAINLGKLTFSENEFIQNAVNYLAETEPEKLKVIEDCMKSLLGIGDDS